MKFLIKATVNPATLSEFGQKLQAGQLNRSLIKSETYCLKDQPNVGYSIREAETLDELEGIFNAWRQYSLEAEISEVISPSEAMRLMYEKQ